MEFRLLIIIITTLALTVSIFISLCLLNKGESKLTNLKSNKFKKIFGIVYFISWMLFFISSYLFEIIY